MQRETNTGLGIVKLAAFLAMALAVFTTQAQTAKPSHPTVVFMTDFGHVDDSVPICKGVMLAIEPDLRLVDLTHDVTPFSILEGARFLAGTAPYFPQGTVFAGVVDPGVGSARKAIVALTKRGLYFVVPDNGLLTLVANQDEIVAAHEITNIKWMIGAKLSSTFHGRDIFSPVAAHIAHGEDWTEVGPELAVSSLVRLNVPAASLDGTELAATVIGTDGPFGNLVTNAAKDDFAKLGYALGDKVEASIDGKSFEIPFVKTFSDVPLGSPLFYIDSRGRLGLAVNQGSFAALYPVKIPAPIVISQKVAAK